MEYLGRGPKRIQAYLREGFLLIRMQGVLNPAEEQLLRISGASRGRVLLKEVRKELIETARPILETLVKEATAQQVQSMHHDISTGTGEEIILFTFVKASAAQRSRK